MFDRTEAFDTNWHGPDDLKPRVYRTQSEKDTWQAVAVENEYRLPQLRPEDVVIDIGAHIGAFSYRAHLNGSRNILAFEIDPWHLEAAQENLRGLDGIELRHAAVVRSDIKRLDRYYYNGSWNIFSDEGISVASFSLDEILGTLPRVRFIKTDSEGSEWPILYTCTKLDRVQQIAGEFHTGIPFHDDTLPPITPAALVAWLCPIIRACPKKGQVDSKMAGLTQSATQLSRTSVRLTRWVL